MSVDGLSLRAAICELQVLKDGKIDKVQQPDKDSLLLTIRSSGQSFKLFISIHAENGRVQLTNLPFENPQEPPMFCMLLRKHLIGHKIQSIVQKDLDRYFSITMTGRNELGDPILQHLCIELMDRHSNICLVQEDKIVDCMRRVSPDMSPIRTLLPGGVFEEPPVQNKKSVFELSGDELSFSLEKENRVPLFQSQYAGVSKNITSYLFGNEPDVHAIIEKLDEMKHESFHPCIANNSISHTSCVLPFYPSDSSVEFIKYESISQAYDEYYQAKDASVRIARNGSSLIKSIEIKLKRARNKMSLYQESMNAVKNMEQYKSYGNLITSNLYAIPKGQSSCKVMDYLQNPPCEITIPLDSLFSPKDNAQKYFKKYKKAKAAYDFAEKMIDIEKDEIEYLEGQLDNISKCSTLQELNEIREELILLKYIKPDQRITKLSKDVTKPLSFVSSDGITIYVGKNNRQNDELTIHTAKQNNVWLHTKDIPGSHVLIDFDGIPSDATLEDAAMLAAYYSHARGSSQIPVDYTLRKNIKKPSGSKPGKVIYSTNQTVYVTPSEERISAISNRSR